MMFCYLLLMLFHSFADDTNIPTSWLNVKAFARATSLYSVPPQLRVLCRDQVKERLLPTSDNIARNLL